MGTTNLEVGVLERVKIDRLTASAAGFFLAAVAALAFPAFVADPTSAPGLLLLTGVCGVVALGLFAFLRAERPEPEEPGADAVVSALTEPAAVVASDGRVVCRNAGWTLGARLPGGKAAPGLFAALAEARRGGAGRTAIEIDGAVHDVAAAALRPDRFLVRVVPATAATTEGRATHEATRGPEHLDAFAAAAPFGAAILEGEELFDAVIVEANPALSGLVAGVEPKGSRFAHLLDPASVSEARSRVDAGRAGPVEVKLTGGRPAHLYVTGDGARRLVYLFDVAGQKELELQLAQAQKMQAIGQLAGGVAHDFNNLLTALQLRCDDLLSRHPVGDPSYEGLNEIRQTGVRAADLVRKLLAFSRKQTVKRETLDTGELISEFEVLLRRLLREDVRLETEYGRNLPKVHADKSQLETAVMNLAVNARDAIRMRDDGGEKSGTVAIRTRRATQAEARALGWPTAPKGDCALIEVGDTGPGIPLEIQAKIFEPFFTTKPVGEGTGMGLATVYGIVQQADGWIALESRPGEGAIFRIFLPEWFPPADAPAAPAVVAPPKPVARDLSGAGKILFVEDEDAVRGIAARLLRQRGYEVIEASDGEEALALAEEHAGEIDMLISDVIMPGLDGPSLLKKARGWLGDAPVMFISGYAEAEFSDLLEGETGVSFLPKPLDIKSLAERVKQELRPAA